MLIKDLREIWELYLTALEGLKPVQCPWPVTSQQPGKTSIPKNSSTCLALGTVICLVISIADSLNFFPARWARLPIAAVNRHAFAKRGHLFGKFGADIFSQPLRPKRERLP